MTTQFNASDFTASKAKPLPVILLLDTSGSMYGDKISSLNDAVRKMLGTFTKEESQANEFLVSVITFGGTASLAYPPTPASELALRQPECRRRHPAGCGDRRGQVAHRGQGADSRRAPTARWSSSSPTACPPTRGRAKLDQFIQDGRSAKCDRMALGIGREAYEGQGRATLERFIAGTEHQVFEAKDAGEIHNFFKFVTMSVVTRSLSQDPNAIPKDSTLKPPTPPAATPEAAPSPAEPVATRQPRPGSGRHHRGRGQLLVMGTVWLVCDTSGSMVEGGKRLIMRGLVRQVEQFLRLGYGPKKDLKLVLWNDEATSPTWYPGDEVPGELLDCKGSADGDALVQLLGIDRRTASSCSSPTASGPTNPAIRDQAMEGPGRPGRAAHHQGRRRREPEAEGDRRLRGGGLLRRDGWVVGQVTDLDIVEELWRKRHRPWPHRHRQAQSGRVGVLPPHLGRRDRRV